MKSKYAGQCKQCGKQIHVGEIIFWKQGYGANCDECGAATDTSHVRLRKRGKSELLSPLTSEEIITLLPKLRQHNSKTKLTNRLMFLASVSFIVSMILNDARIKTPTFLLPLLLFFATILLVFLVLFFVPEGEGISWHDEQRFDAVNSLAAISPLIEVLEINNKDISKNVVRSLIRLLPRLQYSDSALLDVQALLKT